MDHKFVALTEEDRARIVRDRIRSYEADLFGHQMNLEALKAVGEENSNAAHEATSAIETLQTAIKACENIQNDLPDIPEA